MMGMSTGTLLKKQHQKPQTVLYNGWMSTGKKGSFYGFIILIHIALMTRLKNMPLAPLDRLEPGEVYYFAVRAEMDAIELMVPFNYILFFVTLLDFDTDWGFSAPFMPSPEAERP